MRRYTVLWTLPVIALVCGIAGLFLRHTQMTEGFDAATGLPLENSAAPCLAVLSAAVMAALLILTIAKRHVIRTGRGKIGGGTAVCKVTNVLAAVFFGAAGVMLLIPDTEETATEVSGMLSLILAAACFAALITVLLSALNRAGKATAGLTMVPPLVGCLWLLSIYQVYATNPILSQYVYEMLGVVAATMATYYHAALMFEEKVPFARFLFFSCAAVYLCLVSLGGDIRTADIFLNIAFVLYLTGQISERYSEIRTASLRTDRSLLNPDNYGGNDI